MNIIVQKGIDDQSWKHLTGWSEFVFPLEGKGMQWSPVRWHVLAIEEGQPVAHVGFDRFSVAVDGTPVSVVGVGGVVVRPEFQKKRIPALLFDKLHAECPAEVAADTFSLFCPHRLVPYYQKHGYEKQGKRVLMRQFGKSASAPDFAFMTRGPGISPQSKEISLSGPPW